MAEIVDPQVIRFAKERTRVLADKVAALYYAILAYQADYTAEAISAKITAAGASGNLADGAAVDGRSIITGTIVQNYKAAIDQLKTNLEATVVSVGATIVAVNNQIQVNGSPR